MTLAAGTRLGPYEIVSPLGSGGMGEVFRARDTRLDRTVAIKTLRADVSADPDGRARFEREARAVAAISHPHICTLHDVGRASVGRGEHAGNEEVEFLVMELLEGETLDRRLSRGPLPLAEALAVSIQIAGALDCAHRHAVVHRDLKPSNIMLTKGGAKLLDFGIAQFRPGHAGASDLATERATLTSRDTVLGTVQYMAPEQLEGAEVDGRADLFAFGAVMHEMVTGRRAFGGTSHAGVMAAVLRANPPPITEIDPALPRALERLIAGCLVKNPDDRWASAHDLMLMLKGVAEGPVTAPSAIASGNRRREAIAWGIAALAVAAAVVLAMRASIAPTTAPGEFVSLLPTGGTVLTPGEAPQVSPDGEHTAFVGTDRAGRTRLYVRDRGSLATRALEGTDDATMAFWSPDSQFIGFFAGASLKRIPQAGGATQALAPVAIPRGGTWSRDGFILFVPYPNSAPQRIAATGGIARPVPVPAGGPRGRWFPSFLPDSRHYVFVHRSAPGQGASLRLGSIDSAETTDLVETRGGGVYTDPGYLVYLRDTSLVAQRFDPATLQPAGAAVAIVEGVGVQPATAQPLFSVSTGGVIAYVEAAPAAQLVWFDRLGRRLGVAAGPSNYNTLCFRADGRAVIYDAADQSASPDLWSLELPNGEPQRLTFNPAGDLYVTCAPSGADIVFASLRGGLPALYRQNTANPGSERPLQSLEAAPVLPTDWSRDGRWIVLSSYSPKTNWDIWLVPLDGSRPQAFAQTKANERGGHLSPDGRWMAYASDQEGQSEVYVQPFPATGAKWQVSVGGGRQAAWSPKGDELFYVASDSKIVAVSVNVAGASFVKGPSRVLEQTRVSGWDRTNQTGAYAVAPDGERLLVGTAVDTPLPITVVRNWPALLDRK